MGQQLKKIEDYLKRHDIDAVLITKSVNVSYLSDFRGNDGFLLIGRDQRLLLTDLRYKEQAEKESKDFTVEASGRSIYKLVKKQVKKARIQRLAFESEWLSHMEYTWLNENLDSVRLMSTRGLVENMRMTKAESEIGVIRGCVEILKRLADFARNMRVTGLSERDIAARLDYFMRRNGADRPAFDIIVAAGERSSMPHAITGDKKIEKDSIVLIDVGTYICGYCSDLTRVRFSGKISQQFRHIYQKVLYAQKHALSKIRPGVIASTIDAAARDYLEENGLGKYFTHGLGHGIGMEVHERPYISSRSKARLEPGMVFTVEPGVYIPGRGGIRIEDMVLVTASGCEVLTYGINKSIQEWTHN
jgi:Xaa-Pro aminopeptidase